jgi:hypothetical protein
MEHRWNPFLNALPYEQTSALPVGGKDGAEMTIRPDSIGVSSSDATRIAAKPLKLNECHHLNPKRRPEFLRKNAEN